MYLILNVGKLLQKYDGELIERYCIHYTQQSTTPQLGYIPQHPYRSILLRTDEGAQHQSFNNSTNSSYTCIYCVYIIVHIDGRKWINPKQGMCDLILCTLSPPLSYHSKTHTSRRIIHEIHHLIYIMKTRPTTKM